MRRSILDFNTMILSLLLLTSMILTGCTVPDMLTLAPVEPSDAAVEASTLSAGQRISPSYYRDDPALIGAMPVQADGVALRISPSYYRDDLALIGAMPVQADGVTLRISPSYYRDDLALIHAAPVEVDSDTLLATAEQ